MHKNLSKVITAILAFTLLFSGCGSRTVKNTTLPETTATTQQNVYIGTSPVPDLRTGIMEQGLITVGNSFECTDAGVYFMCKTIDPAKAFILYGDHGSDTLVKLCGRPDCAHSDADCNACVPSGESICCYDGYLFAATIQGGTIQLFRMDLDGSNRIKVIDSSSVGESYGGAYSPVVCNGVFFFALHKLGEDGNEVSQAFYYKLDGSMEKPAPTDSWMAISDGVNILVGAPPKDSANETLWGEYLFNPDNGALNHLVDRVTDNWGYYGTEAGYYITEGKIYRLDYATGQTEIMADTGLDGCYRLHGFPDCFVLSKRAPWGEDLDDTVSENRTLYFYNWDFEPLGEVTLDYPMTLDPECVICGETEDRIMLAANFIGVPEYYIEKSDFGTGHIEVHKYNIPDDIIPEEGW